MRNVFKQYGLTMIAVVVGLMSLGIIWSMTSLQYRMVQEHPELRAAPVKAMEEYQYGGAYQMQKEERTIETGQRIEVEDYFKVWDNKGNPGHVEIIDVKKTEDSGIMDILVEENGKQFMCFQQPGVYTLSLQVSVPSHAKQQLEVNIPVQQAVG